MRVWHSVFLLVLCTNTVKAQEKPQPLPAVPVTAEAELVRNAKLREFDRRRTNGIGRFMTEADLAKDQYRQLSDVLMKFPGLMMVRVKGVGGNGGSAAYVASTRGSATIEHISPIFGRNCGVAIWLDGVPVYRGLDRVAASPAFGGGKAPSAAGQVGEPPFNINNIMTQHIAAIEFYAGPATMPPELNATQGTCGALVIWTK
jgi:hypothetical protein